MKEETLLMEDEQAALALRALYSRYGYLPYRMSKFEEYALYFRNKEFLVSDRIITFNDTDGKLLALKPDITLSILKYGEDSPGCKQKVCYDENVYRVSARTGHFREQRQAGLECIGDIDQYDVYEVVSLAARSLSLISPDFVLEISHIGLLSAVLDEVCPDGEFQQQALTFIARKSAHELKALCAARGIDEAAQAELLVFLSAYGDRDTVLKKLSAHPNIAEKAGFRELAELSALLARSPYSARIHLDFSVVNDRNYYTGILFKGFLSGVNDGVLAGGRYDGLLEKMGRQAGAIGFALYLDQLEQLREAQKTFDADVLLLYDKEDDRAVVADAVERLAARGFSVSAQRAIPEKLRWRKIVHLGEEDALC